MIAPRYQRLQTLQCWGDSLTAGYGAVPSQGWVAQLTRRFLHISIFNHGICGRLFSDILAEACTIVSHPAPGEALFLMGGTNDILCGLRFDSLCRMAEREISDLSSHLPVFLGVPPLTTPASIPAGWQAAWQFEQNNETLRQYGDFLRELSRKLSLPLLDFQKTFPYDDRFYMDGIHPNEKGYTLMANLAETVFRPFFCSTNDTAGQNSAAKIE